MSQPKLLITITANTLKEIYLMWEYNPALKSVYQTVWFNFLKVVAEWPDDRIQEWSSKYKSDLENEDPKSLFFHESPLHYVIPKIIPQSVVAKLGNSEYLQLKADLELAITQYGNLSVDASDFDWADAKRRVYQIIKITSFNE